MTCLSQLVLVSSFQFELVQPSNDLKDSMINIAAFTRSDIYRGVVVEIDELNYL